VEIWTNRAITPEMALVEAAKIYRKHLNPLVQYFELGRALQVDDKKEKETQKKEEYLASLKQKLSLPVTELDLATRASRCLKKQKIQTIKELVSYNETDLLKIPNFGKTSLKEIKKKLADLMGLTLGMELSSILEEKKEE
jgi:DNA-directed RNA polymerase subunit alpha